jgi:Ca2+-binding RTX toxin-like protein
VRGATGRAAVISSLALLVLLPAGAAVAAPTKLKQGFTVNLAAARDGTVNDIVVTYGPLKSDPGEGPPIWGHYISDTAGILNLTNPEDACLTEDGTHDFCPDGTSAGEPGAGSDFTVFLNGGVDRFTATSSIGGFTVHGGADADFLKGSGVPTRSPYLGTLGETFYNGDELLGDGGNDLIYGDRGPDILDGGAGNDVLNGGKLASDDELFPNGPDDIFSGGPGNDHIFANQHDKDNLIDCGPGRHDLALIDKADPKPKHCERVRVGA